MSEKKVKNSFHLRVYDLELLKSIEELDKSNRYSSTNELLNCALGIGIEKIYLEFGKRKMFSAPTMEPKIPDSRKIDNLDRKIQKLSLLQEDMFILLNSVEAVVASIYNVQRSQYTGEPMNEELLDSGILAKLPAAYMEIKDKLIERFDRKLTKERKEEKEE